MSALNNIYVRGHALFVEDVFPSDFTRNQPFCIKLEIMLHPIDLEPVICPDHASSSGSEEDFGPDDIAALASAVRVKHRRCRGKTKDEDVTFRPAAIRQVARRSSDVLGEKVLMPGYFVRRARALFGVPMWLFDVVSLMIAAGFNMGPHGKIHGLEMYAGVAWVARGIAALGASSSFDLGTCFYIDGKQFEKRITNVALS